MKAVQNNLMKIKSCDSMIKTKQKSLATLTKELDSVFALYVKLRDCDESGIVKCFVTGERLWYLDCDAAHFIPRAQMGTRWDEMNVHATSIDTNRFDDNHFTDYWNALNKAYTWGQIKSLQQRGRSLQKYMRHEIQDLIYLYTDKVKELKRVKGL